MKKYLQNLFFKDLKVHAFADAQKDILETMKDDIDRQAKELAEKKLETLLSPIEWSKVVSVNKTTKQIYLGNEVITPEKLANLKAEAKFMQDSELWKLMCDTPKYEAQISMFVKGESLDDMKKGKIMLFTLSQQENIINLFR